MRKKRQSSQQCHLVLLGPTSIKAGLKMLVKLTPGFKLSYYNVLFWKKWASRGHKGEGGDTPPSRLSASVGEQDTFGLQLQQKQLQICLNVMPFVFGQA